MVSQGPIDMDRERAEALIGDMDVPDAVTTLSLLVEAGSRGAVDRLYSLRERADIDLLVGIGICLSRVSDSRGIEIMEAVYRDHAVDITRSSEDVSRNWLLDVVLLDDIGTPEAIELRQRLINEEV